MADVSVDLQNTNTKDLYGQGVRAFILQDFETATQALSKVSELLSAEHGSEIHDSLGDVYFYYGKALLELYRKEGGPLGEAVLKDIDEGESEEEVEENDDKGDGEVKDETKEATSDQTSDEVNDELKEEEKAVDDSNTEKHDEEEAGKNESEVEKEEVNADNAEAEAGPSKADETIDELTDIQVAWEVLELAKRIFTERGEEGKKLLAETFTALGEISLESGNYTLAIDDITQGLNIQKTLFGNDNRTVAETYYKLGGAFATNGQVKEAIESFQSSIDYLQNKLENLNKDKDNNKEEIDELNSLIPEVQEKIADMKNMKDEIAKKAAAASDVAKSVNGSSAQPSSSKVANDISHLVKRKRKDDDGTEDNANPAKKPSP